jgi:hypothetical protein
MRFGPYEGPGRRRNRGSRRRIFFYSPTFLTLDYAEALCWLSAFQDYRQERTRSEARATMIWHVNNALGSDMQKWLPSKIFLYSGSTIKLCGLSYPSQLIFPTFI